MYQENTYYLHERPNLPHSMVYALSGMPPEQK